MESRYIPGGSYLETTQKVRVVLTCQAQKRDGSWVHTALEINDLAGGLVNLNGQLMPEHDPEPQKGYVPSGSYKESCKDINVTLHGYCRKIDGSWDWSSLDITHYETYPGQIVNDNGELVV